MILIGVMIVLLVLGTAIEIFKGEAFISIIPQIVFLFIIIGSIFFPKDGYLRIFRDIFGYGMRPWRIVGTAVLVIVICGSLFALADATNMLCSSEHVTRDNIFQSSWLRGYYFSAITFATVGFGDISATGWAAGVTMVEGLLGVILNAALIVVIFRKLIR